ncbi:MAG: hypothetical protein R3D85_05900 [Paracoccaceae bacterium]
MTKPVPRRALRNPGGEEPDQHQPAQRHHRPGHGIVLVQQLDRRAADQHPRADQRRGIAEHAVKIAAPEQDRHAGAQQDQPEHGHRQGIGQPEDQPAGGGQDAEAEDRVDRQRHHRLPASGADLLRLGLGDDPVGDKGRGICDDMHGRSSFVQA